MSARTAVHESLPYVDAEPTPAQRAAAEALITAELASSEASQDSSSLPPLREPNFSPFIIQELERVASKQPLRAIDQERYEEQEDLPASASLEDRQNALSRAYTANTYLTLRHTHLSLLDSFGKNAWLVGNWQTEAELAALERELAEAKRQIEIVNNSRRRAQEEVGAELRGLEETWKKGVGRVLETEIAIEELKREVLERRRAGVGIVAYPDVFNHLITRLGAPSCLRFEDVLSLDEPELLPRHALALILVFPTDEDYEARLCQENAQHGALDSNNDMVWFKQTINNACGLYGIFHALANGPARRHIPPESFLGILLATYTSSPPEERPRVLETSQSLEDMYAEVAQLGTSRVPESAEEEVDYHYVCFVKSCENDHLFELDGDRGGPIDRGLVCGPNDDILVGGGLGFIREYIRNQKDDIGFSLMALAERRESN
ncbi:bcas2 family protein [Seiridium cupressi]